MKAVASPLISRKSRWIGFFLITLILVGIDQVSKYYAIANWKGLPARSFLGDTFRIEYAENHGAFLSFLADASPEVRFWVLVVMNGVVIFGAMIYLLASKNVSRYTFLMFALIAAGGIGNMIDRVQYAYVVDFLNIGIGGLRSGIFNIADMAISAAFLMVFRIAIWGEAETLAEATEQPSTSIENRVETPSA